MGEPELPRTAGRLRELVVSLRQALLAGRGVDGASYPTRTGIGANSEAESRVVGHVHLPSVNRGRNVSGAISSVGITCEYTSSDIDGRACPARSASSRAGTPD